MDLTGLHETVSDGICVLHFSLLEGVPEHFSGDN
jgi:hypothetical protein